MIPEQENINIYNDAIQRLKDDRLYVTSAQDRVRYYKPTIFNLPLNVSPTGTSGTHSALEIIADDIIRSITNYYSVSAYPEVALGMVFENGISATGKKIGIKFDPQYFLINSQGQLSLIPTSGTGTGGGVVVGGDTYTDEQAQDAIARALTNSDSIIFSYNDATNKITAQINPSFNLGDGYLVKFPENFDSNKIVPLFTDTPNLVLESIYDQFAPLIQGNNPFGEIVFKVDTLGYASFGKVLIGIPNNNEMSLSTSASGGANKEFLIKNNTVGSGSNGGIILDTTNVNAKISLRSGELEYAGFSKNEIVLVPQTKFSNYVYLNPLASGVLRTDPSDQYKITSATTDHLPEGIDNLYFTNERVDDRVASLIVAGSGITVTYNDISNTLTIARDSGGATSATDHGNLTGLSDDDHPQYVHVSVPRAITTQHTFNTGGAAFILAAGSQGVLIPGLNADLLDGFNSNYFLNSTHVNGSTTYIPVFTGTNVIGNSILKQTNSSTLETSATLKIDEINLPSENGAFAGKNHIGFSTNITPGGIKWDNRSTDGFRLYHDNATPTVLRLIKTGNATAIFYLDTDLQVVRNLDVSGTGKVGNFIGTPARTLEVGGPGIQFIRVNSTNNNAGIEFTEAGSAANSFQLYKKPATHVFTISHGTNGELVTINPTGVISTIQTTVYNGTSANPAFNSGANGHYYAQRTLHNQIILNSTGSNYGTIHNPSPNTWSLGYTSAVSAIGISVITWDSSKNVSFGGVLRASNFTNNLTYTSAVYNADHATEPYFIGKNGANDRIIFHPSYALLTVPVTVLNTISASNQITATKFVATLGAVGYSIETGSNGVLYLNRIGGIQAVLNSTGPFFGVLSNPSIGLWALGYHDGTLTTPPTNALTWNSSGLVSVPGSFSVIGNTTLAGLTAGSTTVNSISASNLTSGRVIISTNGGGLNVDTLIWDSANKRLAIGGTVLSPSERLHIAGNFRADGNIFVNTAPNTNGFGIYNTNVRWLFLSEGSESGSNAGSNLKLDRYNDAGSSLGTIFNINRATGITQFNNFVGFGGGISATNLDISGQINSSGYIQNRVIFVGLGGAFTSSSIFTYDTTIQRLSLTNALISGQINVSGSALLNGNINIENSVATRGIFIKTNTNNRWGFYVTGDAESGSNAGSNFVIARYTDAGTFVDTPFAINRGNGQVTLSARLNVANQINSTLANGTAPFTLLSSTLNTNLNADLLDGQHGSFYQNAGNINAGTLAISRGGTNNTSFTNNEFLIFDGTKIASSGINSSTFSLAGHNHDSAYVNVIGDTMTGKLIVNLNTNATNNIQNNLYANGHFEAFTGDGSAPSYGFHRGGIDAIALYYSGGNQLRIRRHDGFDRQIALVNNHIGGSFPIFTNNITGQIEGSNTGINQNGVYGLSHSYTKSHNASVWIQFNLRLPGDSFLGNPHTWEIEVYGGSYSTSHHKVTYNIKTRDGLSVTKRAYGNDPAYQELRIYSDNSKANDAEDKHIVGFRLGSGNNFWSITVRAVSNNNQTPFVLSITETTEPSTGFTNVTPINNYQNFITGNITLQNSPIGTYTNSFPPYTLNQTMATDDQWRIYGADDGYNVGKMVFEVGDDGNEQFVWRKRIGNVSQDAMWYANNRFAVDGSIQARFGVGNGFRFSDDAFGGGLDKAFIELRQWSGENQYLYIGVENDTLDDIKLNARGGVIHEGGEFVTLLSNCVYNQIDGFSRVNNANKAMRVYVHSNYISFGSAESNSAPLTANPFDEIVRWEYGDADPVDSSRWRTQIFPKNSFSMIKSDGGKLRIAANEIEIMSLNGGVFNPGIGIFLNPDGLEFSGNSKVTGNLTVTGQLTFQTNTDVSLNSLIANNVNTNNYYGLPGYLNWVKFGVNGGQAHAFGYSSRYFKTYCGIAVSRDSITGAIWFGNTMGQDVPLDKNHVLWNDYYGYLYDVGAIERERGSPGAGFDGMMWNTYQGLKIRGSSEGAVELFTATLSQNNIWRTSPQAENGHARIIVRNGAWVYLNYNQGGSSSIKQITINDNDIDNKMLNGCRIDWCVSWRLSQFSNFTESGTSSIKLGGSATNITINVPTNGPTIGIVYNAPVNGNQANMKIDTSGHGNASYSFVLWFH